ncbi:hypothetical protein F2P56_011071 [Juglans regia]|uniref:WUSCHEL-related homeobox 2 isoform X1 n=2 Tax=Juglans regia TaxID=51240 RepID=A0A2I4FWH1_JUGRE|nr:WUSCHEL-related homeobox 2 isoform X1 [Juglans regia]KAF5470567.1 hypothetical protein F2P56_011071 [Juglans regia]
MEGDNVDIGGAVETPVSSSRWNPTKEQITMLENLYSQGIRTPSAEQIQQITSRLRAYGHIEGKNVFYWFQNHKARQRQKQKQESSMAFANGYFHRTQPLFPPCPNVFCRPYYLAHNDLGFYPQYHQPKVFLAAGGMGSRSSRTEKLEKPRSAYDGAGYNSVQLGYDHHHHVPMDTCNNSAGVITNSSQETLSLFPLHPTGILQGKTGKSSIVSGNSTGTSSFSEIDHQEGSGDQLYFDFFSGEGSCESDYS